MKKKSLEKKIKRMQKEKDKIKREIRELRNDIARREKIKKRKEEER